MRDLWLEHLQLRLPQRPDALLGERLYGCIRQAILDGVFATGSRLPASRELAQGLGISRNTVTKVFDQLLVEGFLTARVGSGTFVADLDSAYPLRQPGGALPDASSDAPTGLSRRGAALIEHASASVRQWGAFMPGVPDVRLFPHARLQRRLATLSATAAPGMLSYPEQGGDPQLRRALANHLTLVRGVHCAPERILITEGLHQGIDLISRLLADPGDLAWLEEPGYWGIRRLLEINGLDTQPVAVDDEGMRPEEPFGRTPRLIFTTPSHHYPLGAVMSIQRRRQLLDLARRFDALIVEDDYDSEFRYSGSPIPSLQGLEPGAPVIYAGTFSKTIYPGLRIAYLVLPEALAEGFSSAYLDLHRGGHGLTQRALAEFIDSGEYARHVRRMRSVYGRRREQLSSLIDARFGASLLPADARDRAGLHLVLQLPDAVDDVALAGEAAAQGVLVRPLSRYYTGQTVRRGLMLGYASVDESEMRAPFERLAACIERAMAE
ncbi:PLP-dependent aminotransferase family protein [Halotalea alkalilenta]|uniref:MocR-like pyridoxine biosynthesis transcription factor PdxR n=1 Tax=Halotalea alkalilenta TaxID=376489 RepID=UPI000489837C|nr:PLP-dependent aminotransferase family protein [Halotalea alkalilenta]